ncbi:site-specific integrase [Nonomuraea sp. NPDC003727]
MAAQPAAEAPGLHGGTSVGQDGYIRDVSWWLWWIQARGLDLRDVSFIEADTYAAAMRHSGLAAGTRRRRLSACSSWYAYLQRADAAARNPFHRMELPKRAGKLSRYFTEAQLDDLVVHAVANPPAPPPSSRCSRPPAAASAS